MNKLFIIVCGFALLVRIQAQCGGGGCVATGAVAGGGCIGGGGGCVQVAPAAQACPPAPACVPAPVLCDSPLPSVQSQPPVQATTPFQTPPPIQTQPPFQTTTLFQTPQPVQTLPPYQTPPPVQSQPPVQMPLPIQNSCGSVCSGVGVPYTPQMGCGNTVTQMGCGGGGSSSSTGCIACMTHRRRLRFFTRHTRNANNETVSFKEAKQTLRESQVDDPVCNSNQLRSIINDNLSADAVKTKKAIYNAAVKNFSGHYAVICSSTPFEFIADSHHYCLHGNDNMTCYAFQSQKKFALLA